MDDRRIPEVAERGANSTTEAGGALSSCADVTWTIAEAQGGTGGTGAAEAGGT